jgi:hypothetical protein
MLEPIVMKLDVYIVSTAHFINLPINNTNTTASKIVFYFNFITYSLPTTAEVEKMWIYTAIPPLHDHGVELN